METFIASRVSEGDNVLFPDKLEIHSHKVVFYKGTLWGYKSTVVQCSCISSVRIASGFIFADVVIQSTGGGRIVARGFTKGDAKRIFSILT